MFLSLWCNKKLNSKIDDQKDQYNIAAWEYEIVNRNNKT